MDLVLTLVIGGVVGWLASIVMGTRARMGIVADVIVGVIGSLVGHWIGGLLGLQVEGGLAHWTLALLGAILLLGVLRALGAFGRGPIIHR